MKGPSIYQKIGLFLRIKKLLTFTFITLSLFSLLFLLLIFHYFIFHYFWKSCLFSIFTSEISSTSITHFYFRISPFRARMKSKGMYDRSGPISKRCVSSAVEGVNPCKVRQAYLGPNDSWNDWGNVRANVRAKKRKKGKKRKKAKIRMKVINKDR
jgi:hypothetical protein